MQASADGFSGCSTEPREPESTTTVPIKHQNNRTIQVFGMRPWPAESDGARAGSETLTGGRMGRPLAKSFLDQAETTCHFFIPVAKLGDELEAL